MPGFYTLECYLKFSHVNVERKKTKNSFPSLGRSVLYYGVMTNLKS